MKILWIVNTVFPYPAKKIGIEKTVFGGWLNSLAENIKANEEIKLAIATVYNGDKILEFNDGTIQYYLLPGAPALKYNKELEKYWKVIDEKFKPDLVHIHGTEYAHGLAFLNIGNKETKKVISIQGLTSCISKVYLSGISYNDIIRNITFRDIIKRDNIFQQKKKFEDRGKYEIKLIRKVDNIIGRTTWDYSNVKAINPNIKYYLGNEILRKSFYENNWNIENIEEYSIFCSQAGYSIKGFHYLLETIYILKKRYPQVKLYVAGENILNKGIKRTGYAKYLSKLINKYTLKENVIFTGILSEEQMVERLLKTHVFVLPSVIENSSNSLGEAMLLGMPCIASNTGGTMDILEHKKEGFVYPYTEPAMCAEFISKFFEDKKLAINMGQSARKTALHRHDLKINTNKIVEIYKAVIGEK